VSASTHEYEIASMTLGKSESIRCSVSVFQENDRPALVATRLNGQGIAITPAEADDVAAALKKAATAARQLDTSEGRAR
jgi:hypothetical protein